MAVSDQLSALRNLVFLLKLGMKLILGHAEDTSEASSQVNESLCLCADPSEVSSG
ncbi:MAG: hypothetical protein WD357_10730 [Gracilimonas sp.]